MSARSQCRNRWHDRLTDEADRFYVIGIRQGEGHVHRADRCVLAQPSQELPVEDKLRWLLEEALHLVEEQLGRGAIAAVLADADAAFSAALRAHLVRRLEALQVEIDADTKAGRVHADTDGEALADLALGAWR